MLNFDVACSCLHFTTTWSRIGANNWFCARQKRPGRAGNAHAHLRSQCQQNKNFLSSVKFHNSQVQDTDLPHDLPNVLVYLGGYQEDKMILAAMSSASNHRLDATESPAAPPDLTNSLTAASATIDLTRVEAIQKKRLVTFVNHFIQRTARNDWNQIWSFRF